MKLISETLWFQYKNQSKEQSQQEEIQTYKLLPLFRATYKIFEGEH